MYLRVAAVLRDSSLIGLKGVVNPFNVTSVVTKYQMLDV